LGKTLYRKYKFDCMSHRSPASSRLYFHNRNSLGFLGERQSLDQEIRSPQFTSPIILEATFCLDLIGLKASSPVGYSVAYLLPLRQPVSSAIDTRFMHTCFDIYRVLQKKMRNTTKEMSSFTATVGLSFLLGH
jgi:hypothetical protein